MNAAHIVDTHAHVGVPDAETLARNHPDYEMQRASAALRYQDPVTKAYMDAIGPVWAESLTNIDTRIAWMDERSISHQVLSVNPGQYYSWANRELAAELVQTINTHLASVAGGHPDRFLAVATVSMQHPDLAAQQLRHAVEDLGMVGAQIPTNAGGRDLSDPAFDDLWRTAHELDCALFIHPMGCPELTQRLAPSYLNNIVGQPLESTIALSHIVFSGVLDRFPDLRICTVHGGGYFPHYLGRPTHAYEVRPDSHSMEHPPHYYLKNLWFDSVVHSPQVLNHLLDVVGVRRVVMGTDYPFDMGDESPSELLSELEGLTTEARSLISSDNAWALLGTHAHGNTAG